MSASRFVGVVMLLGFIAAAVPGVNGVFAFAREPHDHHDHHHDHDHSNTLLDIARKNGQFNTFAAAAVQAGLEETLSHGEYTIFAPTDEAFSRLPAEKLDALLQPENVDKLKALVLNHVVKGKTKSCCIADGTKAPTVGGGEVIVRKSQDGKLTVNGASIVTENIEAENGFVHAIDKVLLPES